ncbi:MAG: 2-hydroxychromene-2-carboxylate isomerase, partial [Pseudomonadota bacterium]|nr:2-hydroxychromene-2-carboxylate isomerase [Pseudomonadota bacterium]
MPKIDYYFSTISPYTYLAGDQLEQIAEKHGA